MQISLKQNEIEHAVLDYIGKLGINLSHSKTELTFTNGRSPSGISVDVFITEEGHQLEMTFNEVLESAREKIDTDMIEEDIKAELKKVDTTKSLFTN